MKTLTKILDLSERVLAFACVAAFAVMLVLGIATVVFRYVVESSLAFPDELIRYLFIWMIFLGSAVALRRNLHAAIGVLISRLSPAPRRAAVMLATGSCGLFFAVLLYSGVQITKHVKFQVSPALEVSMVWVYGAVPAGAAIMLVYVAELLVRQWRAPADKLLTDDH